ncbi:hypothetical protein ACQJBY_026342 [Aegilops geniculata]
MFAEMPFVVCTLLAIGEETLTEFLSKATRTAVEWVHMMGMKSERFNTEKAEFEQASFRKVNGSSLPLSARFVGHSSRQLSCLRLIPPPARLPPGNLGPTLGVAMGAGARATTAALAEALVLISLCVCT